MHDSSFGSLLLESLWRVDVPDMIVAVEVEDGHREGEQRHQAATSGDRKMDVIALSFEFTDELVDRVECSVSMGVIPDIIDGFSIKFQHVGVKMNGLWCSRISVTSE